MFNKGRNCGNGRGNGIGQCRNNKSGKGQCDGTGKRMRCCDGDTSIGSGMGRRALRLNGNNR